MFTIEKERAKEQLMWSEYRKEQQETPIECLWFEKFLNEVPSTIEAQAVIWADKIAYMTHDLEDFLHSPIYTSVIKAERSRNRNNGNIRNTEKKLCEILSSLTGEKIESINRFESRDLIRAITTNLIRTSAQIINSIEELKQEDVKSETTKRLDGNEPDDKKRYLNSLLINFEDDFRKNYYRLRELLDEEYIFSSYVQRSDAKAQKIISSLYEEFRNNYKLTPLEIRIRIDNETQKLAAKCMRTSGMSEKEINEIILKKPKVIEKQLKSKEIFSGEYENTKKKIIERIIASYISTMSDTYAENMFCNLNASKDNYSL